ncbi:MAG: hypothetical protein U1F49_12260 [Rubrivivax sp.]
MRRRACRQPAREASAEVLLRVLRDALFGTRRRRPAAAAAAAG